MTFKTKTVFCTAALLVAAGSLVGCRKTEVVGAAPQDRVITPAPTVIEHDRPVVVDRPVIVDRGVNGAYTERRPDGTTLEHHADGSTTERRPDGTVIERPR
jgi:hypothetical protein